MTLSVVKSISVECDCEMIPRDTLQKLSYVNCLSVAAAMINFSIGAWPGKLRGVLLQMTAVPGIQGRFNDIQYHAERH